MELVLQSASIVSLPYTLWRIRFFWLEVGCLKKSVTRRIQDTATHKNSVARLLIGTDCKKVFPNNILLHGKNLKRYDSTMKSIGPFLCRVKYCILFSKAERRFATLMLYTRNEVSFKMFFCCQIFKLLCETFSIYVNSLNNVHGSACIRERGRNCKWRIRWETIRYS